MKSVQGSKEKGIGKEEKEKLEEEDKKKKKGIVR